MTLHARIFLAETEASEERDVLRRRAEKARKAEYQRERAFRVDKAVKTEFPKTPKIARSRKRATPQTWGDEEKKERYLKSRDTPEKVERLRAKGEAWNKDRATRYQKSKVRASREPAHVQTLAALTKAMHKPHVRRAAVSAIKTSFPLRQSKVLHKALGTAQDRGYRLPGRGRGQRGGEDQVDIQHAHRGIRHVVRHFMRAAKDSPDTPVHRHITALSKDPKVQGHLGMSDRKNPHGSTRTALTAIIKKIHAHPGVQDALSREEDVATSIHDRVFCEAGAARTLKDLLKAQRAESRKADTLKRSRMRNPGRPGNPSPLTQTQQWDQRNRRSHQKEVEARGASRKEGNLADRLQDIRKRQEREEKSRSGKI
jgi:hypothetical protein